MTSSSRSKPQLEYQRNRFRHKLSQLQYQLFHLSSLQFVSITMIRQAPRYLIRQPQQPILHSLRPCLRQTRFVSNAPPAPRPRSWKSLFVRAGLAVGVVYYYNTSRLFAEEPPCMSNRYSASCSLFRKSSRSFQTESPPQSYMKLTKHIRMNRCRSTLSNSRRGGSHFPNPRQSNSASRS